MVLWSIAGPLALVLTLLLFGTVLAAISPPGSDSWVVLLAAVLHYCARFGAVLAAPVVAVFGLLGLVTLCRAQIKRKALTLGICAIAFALPLALVVALYLGSRQ